MSPLNSPHRPVLCAVALSPGLKLFLSGSVLLLGSMGTLPFFHGIDPSPIPPLPDEQITAAPLPKENVKKNAKETIVAEPLSCESKKSGLSGNPPQSVKAEKREKYAQAYPEPMLVAAPSSSKAVEVSTKSVADSIVKPIIVPFREFSSIHEFKESPTTFLDRESMEFDTQPESIDPAKTVDMLLPMFNFAENLKPLSKESGIRTPPDNPFQQQSIEASVTEERRLSPLRPYIELRPLRIPEKR